MSNKLQAIHEEAIRNFDKIQSYQREERKEALEDRRFAFVSGAQWEGSLSDDDSVFANKPKYEVNKIYESIRRINSEYRNNRITVDFVSKDGTQDSELADVCDGLFRADERDSSARAAYDNAFTEAITGGYGAFRLVAEYEDEEDDENENQRIRIKPIYDADSSVFFDIDAKEQDKSDAKYCYVISSMSPDAYEAEYGDDLNSVGKQIHDVEYDWYSPDVVFIAEYYVVEKVKDTVHIYETIAGVEERYTNEDFEEDKALESTLLATGSKKVREKKVTRKKVHKYILSGDRILEDCGYIAGKCIPIIPTFGDRVFIDNNERVMGHVRLAKDMQRLKNMQVSRLVELASKSSTEKPIFLPEQINGWQTLWAEDNIKNNPYLVVNPIKDKEGNSIASPPVGYVKPPQVDPAMAALLQLTETDMKDILGNQQQGDEIVSNISGKAVEMIQNRLDSKTFIYLDNHAVGIRRGGEVWLSMAKELYVDSGRKMKTIDNMEGMGQVELMKPTINSKGIQVEENNLTEASFDVAVDVGASSTTQRQATVRSITGMMQMNPDPETNKVLLATAMMNMEGDGISELRDYFRKQLVGMGAIEPTEEEKALMAQPQEPSAQEKLLLATAEKEEAEAANYKVNTIDKITDAEKKQAETEKIKAQTAEIITEIGTKAVESVRNTQETTLISG